MWKESYKLGVEIIDKQHFELFKMVDSLLNVIRNDIDSSQKEKYKEAIDFMKNYVIKHFRDEESYQESINYSDIENHKKEHKNFVNVVLEYEKNLIETNYDIRVVKKFSGTLVVWLIYHVIETDQKIVCRDLKSKVNDNIACYSEYILESTLQVFKSMFNIDLKTMNKDSIVQNGNTGEIFVKIKLISDLEREVVFGFSKEIALAIIKIMTLTEIDNIDEIAYYAVMEIVNIIIGNAATSLSNDCCSFDITPPELSDLQYYSDFALKDNVNSVFLSSDIGNLCFSAIIS